MTITSAQLAVTWLGNGLTQTFTYPFLIPSPGQCQLVFTDATGKATGVAPGLFSISNTGNSTGGTLTYPLTGGPIAAGTSLTLSRVVPYQQAYHPAVQGPIYNPTLESALDALAMQIMQAASHLGEFTINGKVVTSANFSGALSVSIVNGVATVNVQTTPGPTGAQGPQGEQGETGATGATGARGSLWHDGTGAPGVIAGALPDDQYLDTAAGDVYLFGAGGVWAKTGNIKGLQGPQGSQGEQGIPGTGSSILVYDNGVLLPNPVTSLNITGTGWTLTENEGAATLDITGGGGGTASGTITLGLGNLLVFESLSSFEVVTTFPGIHRYWRLDMVWNPTAPGGNTALAEVEFLNSSGINLVGAGTASGTTGANPPADAFDINTSTFWDTPAGTVNSFLEYDFGVAVAVQSALIFARQDGFNTQGPPQIKFSYSDDGTTFTPIITEVGLAWPTSGSVAFSFGTAVTTIVV